MTSTAVAPQPAPQIITADEQAIVLQEQQSLQEKAVQFVAEADSFQITNNEQFVECGERIKVIAGQKKLAESSKVAKAKDAAYKSWKTWCELLSAIINPIDSADKTYRRKWSEYDQKMKREAERIAREEREAAEAIAREEAELQAQQLLDTAAALEKQGDTLGAQSVLAEAENVASAPVTVAPVVVAPMTPKVQGVSTRETWKAEVTDKMALIKAVTEGKVPPIALDVNEKFLNQQARSLKDLLNYPGVRAYPDTGISVRSK